MPTAAFGRLSGLVPPPASLRPQEWAPAEHVLGIELPVDYKQVVDAYGPGSFDEFI